MKYENHKTLKPHVRVGYLLYVNIIGKNLSEEICKKEKTYDTHNVKHWHEQTVTSCSWTDFSA